MDYLETFSLVAHLNSIKCTVLSGCQPTVADISARYEECLHIYGDIDELSMEQPFEYVAQGGEYGFQAQEGDIWPQTKPASLVQKIQSYCH